MTKKRNKYSNHFKIDAVKLVAEQGYKVSEAARSIQINPNLLHRWKATLEENQQKAFDKNVQKTPEQEELERLHKENAQLKIKKEI